jgi:molybdopterin biosynthesis enzyme
MGDGVEMAGEPREGKVTLVASRHGLLRVQRDRLLAFNMLGDVMCATLHSHTVVRRGQAVAGTRAIPLVVKRRTVDQAVGAARGGIVEVAELRRPRAGLVVTGTEVHSGLVQDAFEPIVRKKIEEMGGELTSVLFAPDVSRRIQESLKTLLARGTDLLITTGGMSVDPDDVTRLAIRDLGARDIVYGSAVLPGAMVLVAYLDVTDRPPVPIIGVPACGMYHQRTVFDLILPRVLAGEQITRMTLAELGHGGLCLGCTDCRYPVCPFGKTA